MSTDRSQQLASSFAHNNLSAFIGEGATHEGKEVVGVAVDEEHGVKIVVSITKYEAGSRLTPEERRAIDALPPGDDERYTIVTPKDMGDADAAVYEAAPRVGGRPVSMVKLAQDAGYCYNHVRECVKRLVTAGWLVRVTGGVRKAR